MSGNYRVLVFLFERDQVVYLVHLVCFGLLDGKHSGVFLRNMVALQKELYNVLGLFVLLRLQLNGLVSDQIKHYSTKVEL